MTKSKGKERYVGLRYWMLNSAAWKSLPGLARALYVEIVQRYNGRNNGRIPFAVRDGEVLHVSHHTVSHLLAILQARGFIVCTRKGAFSLKTTKDASEWRLTEYNNDVIAEYATKEFMRWRPPEDVDIDTLNRQPSHHRKYKTRWPQQDRTVAPMRPCGGPHETVNGKKRQNGGPSKTVRAKNTPSTVAPVRHLQIPGSRGREPGVLLPLPEGGLAEKKPWSTPTVEEAEVPHRIEARPPADHYAPGGLMDHVNGVIEERLRNLDKAWRARRRAGVLLAVLHHEHGPPPQADAVAVISAPDPVPARPMLEGDRRRAAILARNQEALRRQEAEMRGRGR